MNTPRALVTTATATVGLAAVLADAATPSILDHGTA